MCQYSLPSVCLLNAATMNLLFLEEIHIRVSVTVCPPSFLVIPHIEQPNHNFNVLIKYGTAFQVTVNDFLSNNLYCMISIVI
jgi:hypothetical protein